MEPGRPSTGGGRPGTGRNHGVDLPPREEDSGAGRTRHSAGGGELPHPNDDVDGERSVSAYGADTDPSAREWSPGGNLPDPGADTNDEPPFPERDMGTGRAVPGRPVPGPGRGAAPGGGAGPVPHAAVTSGPAHEVTASPVVRPRPAFRSLAIRSPRDAVTAAALYLRWLGFEQIRRADQRPPSGIGLAARGLLAQVEAAARPASLRDVECLWLTAMTESADCACFSLAGYTEDARACADALGIPLFVLDPTGRPRAVNGPADALHTAGA
ncbi:hypothetical protein P3H78_08065 [Streptomyces sp. K1PA1]|uniref:Restriction endonuclease type IV Mrr domain-containing protein n=1 Tax=Streptomyces tropicalis TaxID=3034234 RepID=A0ABT6A1R0_9ACTN|nr:hypothetical protein [Streptomyces tropicalis]MDF3298590.1 hypothetical protein [Streptomyces tropicalis]